MSGSQFDYVVVGSGIGAMVASALLARQGLRVCVLERHARAGGYGHSFQRHGYTFCAELHYLWNCGPKDEFGRLLRYLGLQDEITFVRLDPDGFDRLYFPSFRYAIMNGLDRNSCALSERFPEHQHEIRRYFRVLAAINRELYRLPLSFSLPLLLCHPLKFRHLARYRNWTTDQFFDQLGFPLALRSILAGQSGDLGLPPGKASLLIQAAISCGYDAGAYVPEVSYRQLFDGLVGFIRRQPGCEVHFHRWVTRLDTERARVRAATTSKGEVFQAGRFLFNGDPRLLPSLVDRPLPSRYTRRLDYRYSGSSFTLYLGVRGLDLRDHGFGNWNVWHYPHDDLDRCYALQVDQQQMDDPMLFMSTPTLHSKRHPLAPAGCQQLVVAVPCSYSLFARRRREGRAVYQAEKRRVTEHVLDQIERHYVPSLRQHLDLLVAGTPLTNERYVLAPCGNAYGADLTPEHVNVGKLDYRTPLGNLWLVGATAGAPSFAGGTHFARLLVERLTGSRLLERAPPAAAQPGQTRRDGLEKDASLAA